MTFQKAKELEAGIRSGSFGTPVVYADRITRTETNPEGKETERSIPFVKSYTVFYTYSYCTILDL